MLLEGGMWHGVREEKSIHEFRGETWRCPLEKDLRVEGTIILKMF
jgi:hypothetical protein